MKEHYQKHLDNHGKYKKNITYFIIKETLLFYNILLYVSF